MVYINVTKNRKPIIIPLNENMMGILKEYLEYRGGDLSDYLFCNVYGHQLTRSTFYHQIYEYNKSRGVETTGIHRFRHTFAKKWILMGGSVVSLQKILSHSSLAITEHYINLLVSDLKEDVEKVNIIGSLQEQYISMKNNKNNKNNK